MKWAIILTILLLLVACTAETSENNETKTKDSDDSTSDETGQETVLSTKGDLIPKIYTESSYPELNQELDISAAVQNYGVQRIEGEKFDYRVVLSRDGTNIIEENGTYDGGTMLPTEEFVIYTFSYEFDSYGEYEVNVTVDLNNQITELKENNNEKTITIYVKEKSVSDDDDDDDEDESTETGLADDDAKDEVAKSGCYDSDGGKEFETKGICYDDSSFINGRSDFCAGDDRLAELYCENKRCGIKMENCEGICKEGKCI